MEKKYEQKYMRKVYFMQDGDMKEAFLPDQATAELFLKAMQDQGNDTVGINRWTWEVLVEA